MADTDTAPTTPGAPGSPGMVMLPVVPLSDAVLLPGTVATLTLDTEDVPRPRWLRRGQAMGGWSWSPRSPVASARVGVIAEIEQVGQLPTGAEAAILRVVQRAALVGRGGRRAQRPLAGGRAADRRPSLAPRRRARCGSCGWCWRRSPALRRSRRLPEILRSAGDAGALTDAVTAWSEVSDDHRLTVLEATEVGARVELVLAWAKDHLAELKVNEQIRSDVTEGVEKQQREYLLRQQLAAIRKELGEDDGDPADRLPGPTRRAHAAGEGAGDGREGDRPAGAHQQPEPRAGLDPHLAGPGARPALGPDDGRQPGPGGRPRGARRRPPRAGRRQGPHRRVPGRAQAAPRAGPGRPAAAPEDGTRAGDIAEPRDRAGRSRARRCRGPSGRWRHRHPGRSAGRRQDLARGERRSRHGSPLRARRPRRRPGRGRDPRPPAHLRGQPARPHRPCHHRSRDHEPGRAAGRGGQAVGRRVVGRSHRRAAGGARPGAEPHLPGPLPRGRPRPVGRGVPGHRQHDGDHPRSAARPDGAGPPRRLHRGREGLHRPQAPAPAPAGGGRAA